MATSTTDRTSAPGGPSVDLRAKGGLRNAKNILNDVLMVASFVIVCIPLVAVLWSVVSLGLPQITWSFLTDDIPAQTRSDSGGIGPAIIGTILITFAATVIAVPLGILGAVYLHEYGGKGPFAQLIRFLSNVMSGVPSVVMGLFIFVIYTTGWWGAGLNGFGGSLALACLMLPVVIRSTEEMLRLVPDNLREASYGLGARQSRTIMTVVLPSAAPGIVSGSLLAVARAAGETAPLVFTIGAARSVNWNLLHGPNNAMSKLIFENATSVYPAAQDRAWGTALVLVVLAFVLTVTARVVTAQFTKQR